MRSAQSKIKSINALAGIIRKAKASGKVIVFTNGCFDLLHPGHVKMLEQSRRSGDLLVVGMNSDKSVRAMKGPKRPILAQKDRARILGGLESVDYVTIFNDPTPMRLIKRLNPNILIKGSDWSYRDIVGSRLVRRRGGRVIRVALMKGYSTTALIKRISDAK